MVLRTLSFLCLVLSIAILMYYLPFEGGSAIGFRFSKALSKIWFELSICIAIWGLWILQLATTRDGIWKVHTNRSLGSNHIPLTASFHFKTVNPVFIEKLLNSLKTLTATGPDDILASMLKDASGEPTNPLCFVIYSSLKLGVFPTIKS